MLEPAKSCNALLPIHLADVWDLELIDLKASVQQTVSHPKSAERAILPVRHVERACFGVIEIYSNVQAPQSQIFRSRHGI